MLDTVYFILTRTPLGQAVCHGLRFTSADSSANEWSFPEQSTDLEAVLIAVDSYPRTTIAKIADLTFLGSSEAEDLIARDDKQELYRLASMSAVPLLEWLAKKGHFLVDVSPCFALASQSNTGRWTLSAKSMTDDPSKARHVPALDGQGPNKMHWVEITHRGIRFLREDTMAETPDQSTTPPPDCAS